MPQWPSAPGINVLTLQFHAHHGVYVTEFEGIMHRGTHMDAPLHVTENTPSLTGYPLWRFFGTGVAVSIPKGKWGVITADDLEKATPKIRKNDIVMINTGTHHKLADSDEYYAYSPGLYKESAEWLVDKQVKMVGVDVQALDHPLGTKLVDHGPGPSHPHLDRGVPARDRARRDEGFPALGAGHKTLMVQRRHPRHRERQRRSRCDHRQALHLHGLSLALAARRGLRRPRRRGARSGADLPHRSGRGIGR